MNELFDNDKETQAQTNFELEVKNFGPLLHAKIDLRPLTVFVGPSNTGKSYMAMLIYALNRYFSENEDFSYRWRFLARHRVGSFRKFEMGGLIEWIESELKDKGNSRKISLSGPVRSLMKDNFEGNASPLIGEFERCFGIEIKELRTKNSKRPTLIKVQTPLQDGTGSSGFTLKPLNAKLTLNIPDELYLTKQEHERLRDLASVPEEDEYKQHKYIAAFNELLSEIVNRYTLRRLNEPVYYLPAGRTGIMQAHNVVMSALINSASMAGIRPSAGIPALSGVLADFLDQLINFEDNIHYPRRRYRYRQTTRRDELKDGYVKQIQRNVLDGQVTLQKDQITKYPTFDYKPDDWEDGQLPLRRASSMVSEVAPVLLYLEHIVRKGNLLIVEEPESHLHPAKQVELIQQLAKVVEAGIRVIVTTHSEWILEELSNIVRTSKLNSKEHKSKAKLASGDVGVWLFNKTPQAIGSKVKEIKLDETGLYPSEFDKVAMALHNDWAKIESEMSKSKEETN